MNVKPLYGVGDLDMLATGIKNGGYSIIEKLVPILVVVLAAIEISVHLASQEMNQDPRSLLGFLVIVVQVDQPGLLDFNGVQTGPDADFLALQSPASWVFRGLNSRGRLPHPFRNQKRNFSATCVSNEDNMAASLEVDASDVLVAAEPIPKLDHALERRG